MALAKESGVSGYDEHRRIAERRGPEKKVLPNGKKLRGHSIPDDKLAFLLADWQKTGIFPSPYTRGIRSDHLQALVRLGVNRVHSLGEVRGVLQEIMGEDRWEKFITGKRGKNGGKGGVTSKLIDNYRSFRRLCLHGGHNPYGYRLRQFGCTVDIFKQLIEIVTEKKTNRAYLWYVRLNTYSTVPLLKKIKSRETIPEVDVTAGTSGPVVTVGWRPFPTPSITAKKIKGGTAQEIDLE